MFRFAKADLPHFYYLPIYEFVGFFFFQYLRKLPEFSVTARCMDKSKGTWEHVFCCVNREWVKKKQCMHEFSFSGNQIAENLCINFKRFVLLFIFFFTSLAIYASGDRFSPKVPRVFLCWWEALVWNYEVISTLSSPLHRYSLR